MCPKILHHCQELRVVFRMALKLMRRFEVWRTDCKDERMAISVTIQDFSYMILSASSTLFATVCVSDIFVLHECYSQYRKNHGQSIRAQKSLPQL